MKPKKVITIIIFIIVVFLFSGQWAYKKGYEKGLHQETIYLPEELIICKKQEGKLYVSSGWGASPVTDFGNWANIKCVKSYTEGNKEITETLFDYNF